MRLSFCLVCSLVIIGFGFGFGCSVRAEGEPATYQRQRQPSSAWGGRHMPGGVYPGIGWPMYGGGFYGHAYAGSWYQRPYPYHFDYYRGRFDRPPAGMNQPACPCAQPTVAE